MCVLLTVSGRGVRFSRDESQKLKCIFASDLFSCE